MGQTESNDHLFNKNDMKGRGVKVPLKRWTLRLNNVIDIEQLSEN